jgi:S-formylglutathione hydrolase FrmB
MAKRRARKGTLHPCLVTSKILGGRRPMFVYTPAAYARTRKRLPLLLLLHGMWGCEHDWPLKGNVCRTLDRLIAARRVPPMIVAMPSDGLLADGTFYVNWHSREGRFEDYVMTEALALADGEFRTSKARGRRAIAGLSMGGFGAMVLGLRQPQQFSVIAGLSSLTRPPQAIESGSLAHRAFGPGKSPQSAHHRMYDPWQLLKDRKLAARTRLYLNCGTEDQLLAQNRAFHAHLEALGVTHVYEEFAGAHDWPYWTKHIVDALQFIARHLK